MQHELDVRFKQVENFTGSAESSIVDERLKSYLYKLGAVLICGNIEQSVQIILLSRLHARAHPRVLNFVKSHFTRGQNLDCAAISQLLQRFDAEWYRKFQKFVEDNPSVKEGVSSCYAVRNSVAHGGAMGVGGKRIMELLDASKTLLDAVVRSTA